MKCMPDSAADCKAECNRAEKDIFQRDLLQGISLKIGGVL